VVHLSNLDLVGAAPDPNIVCRSVVSVTKSETGDFSVAAKPTKTLDVTSIASFFGMDESGVRSEQEMLAAFKAAKRSGIIIGLDPETLDRETNSSAGASRAVRALIKNAP